MVPTMKTESRQNKPLQIHSRKPKSSSPSLSQPTSCWEMNWAPLSGPIQGPAAACCHHAATPASPLIRTGVFWLVPHFDPIPPSLFAKQERDPSTTQITPCHSCPYALCFAHSKSENLHNRLTKLYILSPSIYSIFPLLSPHLPCSSQPGFSVAS